MQTDGVADALWRVQGVGARCTGRWACAADGTGFLVHRCLNGRGEGSALGAEVQFVV